MTNDMKNILLQQSYQDAWEDYEKSLTSKKMITWDYVILTASNEAQADAFRKQIDFRLKKNLLPARTHYCVLPDPDGKRVGSGGATFCVLRYIKSHTESFKNKRILVIHSGGDSKRIPQYSACGKLFSPVPRLLPDGRRSTLFDEFIISMSGVTSRMKDGMLVLSGDVLMLFDPLQIDFQSHDVCAVSIKEHVNTGKNHGVFLTDNDGNVLEFLHKQSVETLIKKGAVDSKENVNIDTGAVLLSSKVLDDLYSLIKDEFDLFVNEKSRISFYADFLYPVAQASCEENYYLETPEGEFTEELKLCRSKIWKVLSPYSMRAICLSPAEFIHFGTTKELLTLVTEKIDDYSFLGWSNNVLSNKDKTNYAVSNSIISDTAEIADGSYIEDSYILGNTKIGKGCIISNMTLNGEVIPDNTVLHGLKLKDGDFVVRRYPTDENPKEDGLWEKKRFYACDTIYDSLNGIGDKFTSLYESFNNADTDYILSYQTRLWQDVKIENFKNAIRKRLEVSDSLKTLGVSLDEDIIENIIKKAENEDYDTKIRMYYYLSQADGIDEDLSEQLETLCFSAIRSSVTSDFISYRDDLCIQKDEVRISLPVRVNWGGGWSDTPPYCTENGGTVLNAAISLNGKLPIRACAKKLDTFKIILESVDSHDIAEFENISDIQDNNNPFDPFAIHKAALISCGIIPKDGGDLSEILKRLGGGIYLSTEVVGVPRGSGLGTSSILAAACAKALMRFIGISEDNEKIYATVLCMEQLMSTGGGWQDQVGGLVDGVKIITSQKGENQKLIVTPAEISDETYQKLESRFALVYTGQRRLARNILRKVMGAYISSDKKITDAFSKIRILASDMKNALENDDIDKFANLLNEHWELSRVLYDGCSNASIDRILLSIDDLICGRFIAGAGGGGFLQVILKDSVTKDMLKERLTNEFPDSEINVWDSKFIRKEQADD